ncbi:hypothetical protein C8Q79DRAFT_492686 [Trametes meyenii]|nr:hypothetical protein C8Q79DRAFT_492686 [Trametes meyenii]
MPPRSHTGPSLPQALLEELNGEKDSAHKHKRKGGGRQLSRKDARKLERDSRKQRKAEFFSSHPPKSQQNGKRRAEGDHVDSPQRKKVKVEPAQESASRPVPSAKPIKKDGPGSEKQKKSKPKSALEKLAERAESSKAGKQKAKKSLPAPSLRTPQEEEEDAYIAYMERKLGWVKGGKRTTKYGRGEEEDGLDELLNDLDAFEPSMPSSLVSLISNGASADLTHYRAEILRTRNLKRRKSGKTRTPPRAKISTMPT